MDYCDSLGVIVPLVKNIINLIKWGIPIVLIVFGMIDLGKAVMAGKEDEMKKAQSTLIKRVLYAVLVFLVVTIVTFVLGLLSDASADVESESDVPAYTDTSWYTCFFGRES